MGVPIAKNYSSTYLYGKAEYEKKIFNFIMSGDEIDKHSDKFADILFDFKKRQVYNGMVKGLMSENVVLKMSTESLPKAFKVMCATDPRDKKMKVFIDVSDIITFKDGIYVCKHIDILISYVLSATNMLIYYRDPRTINTNAGLVSSSTEAFADLFMYVLEYLRISGVQQHKKQLLYLISTYYQYTLLGRDLNETTKSTALKVSGLTAREASIVDIRVNEEDFDNIKTFVDCISRILSAKDLTVEVFVDRWTSAFGTSTYFGCELYTAFATMLTDAYVGAYINNQKIIEKIVGRNMITFVSKIMNLGDA